MVLACAAALKDVSDVANGEDNVIFWRQELLEANGGGVFLSTGSAFAFDGGIRHFRRRTTPFLLFPFLSILAVVTFVVALFVIVLICVRWLLPVVI